MLHLLPPELKQYLQQRLNQMDQSQVNQVKQLASQLLCERSFHYYVKEAWSIVEPGEEFRDNWHIEGVCRHLQALATGELTSDLLINIPPGCMKSLLVSVFWPTWVWGPAGKAAARFLYASYQQNLATRDSIKCRDIIESKWYQARWGKKFRLLGDQNEKTYYKNSRQGWRLATSPGGRGTGEHPDYIICDDPHNVEQAESELQRAKAINWWSGTIPTRGISRGAKRVIAMQRLDKKDLSAYCLENEDNWCHLCLPMRYEPGRMPKTPLGWEDPRKEPGELLWPALFSEQTVAKLEKNLRHRALGQLQQRPTNPEGGLFKGEKFQQLGSSAWPAAEQGDQVVLYWDKAATEGAGCYTAGVLMMLKTDGRLIVIDVTRGQWGIDKRNQQIEMKSRLAAARYKRLKVWIEEEPGSGGKESALYTIRKLLGLRVEADKKSQSKEESWEPWADQVNAGNVWLVDGDWNPDFIQEHVDAPNGKYKDQLDAAAGACNKLSLSPQVDMAAWLAAT